ncbi:MAG: ribonuclease P protein component [Patescibacteria group bacterium]
MLSSKNRLRKKSDINNVFKKGKTVAGHFIFLRATKNELKDNRFAFVVSLKVSKKAVVRNKIKRQLREIVKQAELKQGFDFMIITKPSIIGKSFQEIKQDLNEIFNFKINKIISA